MLDLSLEQIRQATPKPSEARKAEALQSVGLQNIGEADMLPLAFGAAHNAIERLGPWALLSPVVLTPLIYLLLFAQSAPTKVEASAGADAANSLLDALRPDLSRHMSRTPHQLTSLHATFGEYFNRARHIKELLRDRRPLHVIRARARDWFGPRLDERDLRQWERMTATQIATEALRSQMNLSAKALRDLRGLADKAGEIAAEWEKFLEHLKTRSEQDRSRITDALPTLVSPRPPQNPEVK